VTDPKRGVYQKYRVERTDGTSRPTMKHEHCTYFVLDLDHDEFAIPALIAYATACAGQYPELARDLRDALATRPCGCRSVGECTHLFQAHTPAERLGELMRKAQ
jgi:hypothetical protein